MRLIRAILALLRAPFSWLRAAIKNDRFLLYPGKCVIFIGLPGTGKTLGAICMLQRSKHMYKRICATEDAGLRESGNIYTLSPDIWATRKLRSTAILVDESALNGFFARDFGANFSARTGARNKLVALKLRRHLHNGVIITTQSLGDNDTVVRQMTDTVYICRHSIIPGRCVAERAVIWYEFDGNGNYRCKVDRPTFFEKLTNPYQFYSYSVKKYKKFYNSFAIPQDYDRLTELD